MIRILQHHREHFKKVGVRAPLFRRLRVSEKEYAIHAADWQRSGFSGEEVHKRVLAHVLWKRKQRRKVLFQKITKGMWPALAVLGLLLALGAKSHCQFSHINTITVTDGTNSNFAASPFSITFSNCTVGGTSTQMTVTCSGGSSLPSGTTSQSLYYASNGTTVTPFSGLNIAAGALNSYVLAAPNNACLSGTQACHGFTGTDGTSQFVFDYVNQDTSGGNVMSHFLGQVYSTNFLGTVNQSFSMGWNLENGGRAINGQPSWGYALEGPYNLNGTNINVESHWWLNGINTGELRPMTTAWDQTTGATQFFTMATDVGLNFTCLTGINCTSSPVTGVTPTWSSANGGTFTFPAPSGNWTWDMPPLSYALVTGCVPSAYNHFSPGWEIMTGGAGTTSFTVTGVGSNPGTITSTCTVQGGALNSYLAFSASGAYGFQTKGPIPATIGGSVTENANSNANAGFTMFPESGQFGGSSNPVVFHAGGSSGITPGTTTCSTVGIFQFPATASNEYLYCNGTKYVAPGEYNLSSTIGLNPCSSCALTIPILFQPIGSNSGLDIATNYSSQANHAGKITTSNGGGSALYDIAYTTGSGGGTALTDLYSGAWSGITLHLRDGATAMIDGDGSGDPNLLNTVKFHGTTGLSQSGVLCSATFTTIAGGVTACTAVSDPRLKVFAPYHRGLDAVLRLRPIHYHWNDEGRKVNGISDGEPDEERVGWNAANVKKVMPEAVGSEDHDGTQYLSLPHGNDPIVAALVNAVQEQQKEIAQLQAQIAKLQTAR